MIKARTTGINRTLQALARGPSYALLLVAIVAIVVIGALAAKSIDTPSSVPVTANAPVGLPSVRDPSVPEAGAVLPADDQQQEVSVPTF